MSEFENSLKIKELYQLENDPDYELFMSWSSQLNEGFNIKEILSSIPSALKQTSEFIKSVVSSLGVEVKKIIELLQNKKVFSLLKIFEFSLSKIYSLFKIANNFLHTISEKISETKFAKDVQKGLAFVDQLIEDFLNSSVVNEIKFLVKHGAGWFVGGLLIYIWFQMSFTGDAKYDFDLTTSINAAFHGNFKLAEIFAGAEGIKMLTLLATGIIFKAGFPYPGPNSVKFIAGFLYSLAKKYGYTDLAKTMYNKFKESK